MRRAVWIVIPALLGLGPTAAAKAKFEVGKMSVNGQEVRQLSCELESGGLFATVSVVGALAKQKKALDACLPQGGAFQVKWTWSATQPTEIEVVASSDARRSTCVARAVKLTKGEAEGICTAIILVGNPAAAEKAAAALGKK